MQAGRNDPCPCGSGKKYKKCCLSNDRELEPAFIPPASSSRASTSLPAAPVKPPAALPSSPPTAPKAPVDPHVAALHAHWNAFTAHDYEGRIELFVASLDNEALMDSEMAFAMLDQLFAQSRQRSDPERFNILARSLHERRADLYAENAIYIVSWLISNSVEAGQWDEVHRLGIELAPIADSNIDQFLYVLDELAYHGRLATLVAMMRIAWPRVKESRDVMGWAIAEFGERAAGYELFAYVQEAASPSTNDPALLERLLLYVQSVDADYVSRYINALIGRTTRPWTMADFHELQPRQKSRDWDDDQTEYLATPSLVDFTSEFLGHLVRVEGVSYTKGELGRKYLVRYLRRRAAGDLEPRESMLDDVLGRTVRKPTRAELEARHLLCPDRVTWDRFLAGLIGFLSRRFHALAATMELVPAWLRFLEARDLIDSQRRLSTMDELTKVRDQVRSVIVSPTIDSSLWQGIEAAWVSSEIQVATSEVY